MSLGGGGGMEVTCLWGGGRDGGELRSLGPIPSPKKNVFRKVLVEWRSIFSKPVLDNGGFHNIPN